MSIDEKIEILDKIVSLLREDVADHDFDTVTIDGEIRGDISSYAVSIGILLKKGDDYRNLAPSIGAISELTLAFRRLVEHVFSRDGALVSGATIILSADGPARAKFDFGPRESPLRAPNARS